MSFTRRGVLASGATMVALLGRGARAANAEPAFSPASGRLFPLGELSSDRVVPRAVDVWVPDGATAENPARVVYVHDGKNFFDPAQSYSGVAWEMDDAMTKLAGEGIEPAVVVAIASPSDADRPREYNSRHLWDRLTPKTRAVMARSCGGEVRSDDYLAYLTETVMPRIEADFPVRRSRSDTFLLGSSMGALISLEALASHPDRFGGAGCLSAHLMGFGPFAQDEALRPTDEQVAEVTAAVGAFAANDLPAPDLIRLWIDRGTEELDEHYPPFQESFEAGAERAGFTPGDGYRAQVFKGTGHHERYWAARLPEVLRFLLG
ncbi:alpha/beta hydrolase [Parvularcula dongshanensis]|uniref:Acyl-CoA:diacylglycerol acyltransferase n=1 Tax=Parvularcula dongshanensis TaxID=1173995 RepID=A0A840I5Y2_9PROT|nr:alpha/beta hydrolase-fold protein [Parvularcula dongshanensis]MBB4659594.1 putative alpha/beta superfamily hydrolase [Parvularcula dongshanensis]